MTVLPFVVPWAPWSLYLGCILANLGSPFLVWDLTLGAAGTLAAALITRRMSKPLLAPLPPVLVNALVVSSYVAPLTGMPYPLTAAYIAAGEIVVCYLLGTLFLYFWRNENAAKLLRGDA